MALSESVTSNLKDAEQSLRAALSFASRQERSTCCVTIAKLINDLEKINTLDTVQDDLEGFMTSFKNTKGKGKDNPFNPF